MKILVTGGAGFIGSHVVDKFVADGHEVAILDNLSTGNLGNINPKARFYQADLSDDLDEVFSDFKPEVVDHHAAQVNVRKSVDDPIYDATVNVLGTIRLCEAAVRHKVRKIIYISSGGASYGEPEKLPAPESTPVRPLCPYGASKYAADVYVGLYGRLHGIAYTVLRYANVYGPRQDPHGEAGVVAIFSELMLQGKRPTIFGDGSKTRDYVYVEDVAEANVLALTRGDGRAYNIGVGRQISDNEIFHAVRDALGIKMEPIYADFRLGEVRHISLDTSLIRNELGWSAKMPLEAGMKKAAEFYRRKLGK